MGYLRRQHGNDPAMAISHETIYRSIYTTRWKLIPKELCKRLRTGRPIRKNKRHTVKGQWRSQIIDARPIEQRPEIAEGHSTIVAPELIKAYDGLDPQLRDTLTWDRGMELAEHKQLTAATGVDAGSSE